MGLRRGWDRVSFVVTTEEEGVRVGVRVGVVVGVGVGAAVEVEAAVVEGTALDSGVTGAW